MGDRRVPSLLGLRIFERHCVSRCNIPNKGFVGGTERELHSPFSFFFPEIS